MNKKINVLIFPCGSINALEIHTALKDCFNIQVFGGTSQKDHGAFVFKNYISGIPYLHAPEFINFLNRVVEENNIDVVFPTDDTAMLFFARHVDSIKAKVVQPGVLAAELSRYKDKLYKSLYTKTYCPETYTSREAVTQYPVFVKPVVGSGGQNTRIVYADDEFKKTDWNEDFIVVEYLSGEELTIDCFSDRFHRLRFVGPRTRSRIFAGVSVNSFTIPLDEEINKIANELNEMVKFRGLWYFQVKKDRKGTYKLLEISVRTAGTMNLYRNLGVNFPMLAIYDLLERDIEIIKNDFYLEVDRTLINRYKSDLQYSTIYIDFDDTITKNGQVNPFVLMYLHIERNKGKKIKVLTRHEFDFDETLNRLAISKGLFDEVIRLTWDHKKYLYIKETSDVIFIDNAFQERMEVKKLLNIPVFDVDAVQCLIDWRE
jgi:hypothetical protein